MARRKENVASQMKRRVVWKARMTVMLRLDRIKIMRFGKAYERVQRKNVASNAPVSDVWSQLLWF